jgi:ribonuclease J
MKLIIHRGSHQVGGSCVEVASQNSTVLVDVGLPLTYGFGDDIKAYLPGSLFEDLRKARKEVEGVLLSHAHLDHYGLAGMLPPEIPLYCGEATAELIKITGQINPSMMTDISLQTFRSEETFQLGAFSVTPYLMDHSAFDAYGFLIMADDTSIFYTGDFRGHGRKGKLLERLARRPLAVDALLIEGTLLGPRSDERMLSESQLEEEFVRVIDNTQGIVLVTTSSQNIDRLVTIFRAARRTGRKLIIDFYTAEILYRLGKYARIPQPDWPRIRVCFPHFMCERFEKLGLEAMIATHRQEGIKWTRIHDLEKESVMLVRPIYLRELKKYLGLEGATWIYSMWSGYLDQSESLRKLRAYLDSKGVRFIELHTSGHATLQDLKKLAKATQPKTVIPIHTFYPERFTDLFSNVRLADDGEEIEI